MAATPDQFIRDVVNASFQAAYDASSWVTAGSIKSAWDTALRPENIAKEQAKFASILAADGLQICTTDTPPVPVPFA